MTIFGENLRRELNYQDITYKKLSHLTGINYTTLVRYVHPIGVYPSVINALKIARVLNVSVEYLCTGNEPSIQKQFPLLYPIIKNCESLPRLKLQKIEKVVNFLIPYL